MNSKNGKVFTSKFVGTGPSSYEKRIYRAAVSQRLRNTALHGPLHNKWVNVLSYTCTRVKVSFKHQDVHSANIKTLEELSELRAGCQWVCTISAQPTVHTILLLTAPIRMLSAPWTFTRLTDEPHLHSVGSPDNFAGTWQTKQLCSRITIKHARIYKNTKRGFVKTFSFSFITDSSDEWL